LFPTVTISGEREKNANFTQLENQNKFFYEGGNSNSNGVARID